MKKKQEEKVREEEEKIVEKIVEKIDLYTLETKKVRFLFSATKFLCLLVSSPSQRRDPSGAGSSALARKKSMTAMPNRWTHCRDT